jgi:hypothetical protein
MGNGILFPKKPDIILVQIEFSPQRAQREQVFLLPPRGMAREKVRKAEKNQPLRSRRSAVNLIFKKTHSHRKVEWNQLPTKPMPLGRGVEGLTGKCPVSPAL